VLTLLCMMTAVSFSLSSKTMTRYVARAQYYVYGYAAKWAHTRTWTSPTNNQVARLPYYIINDGSSDRQTTNPNWTFSIKNDSEVTVEYTPYIYAYNTDDLAQATVSTPNEWGVLSAMTNGATPSLLPDSLGGQSIEIEYTVTGATQSYTPARGAYNRGYLNSNPPRYRVGPGGTASFTVNIFNYAYNTVATGNSTHRCRFYVRAEQVD